MKQEIKKGYEWYRTLTKKQQKQWRKNRLYNVQYDEANESRLYNVQYDGAKESRLNSNFYSTLNKATSKKHFILSSFVWSETPQGFKYWNDIANKNK